ncbi:MAG: hypothetical protein ACREI8_05330, partial [Myxococcota bacterium]
RLQREHHVRAHHAVGLMADSAAHLVDSVLPEVPIRQWVMTLPWQVRAVVGYDRRLCAAVFDAFAKELMALHERRAKRELHLGSVREAHTGTITFVQRFDSALRLAPHAHVLMPDGVWVRAADGALDFHALSEPTLAELGQLAERTAARIERVFEVHGRSFEEPCAEGEPLMLEHPALMSCYEAATAGRQLLGEHPGAPVLRVMGPVPATKTATRPALVAEARGVNVHAERVVDGRDKKQLERLEPWTRASSWRTASFFWLRRRCRSEPNSVRHGSSPCVKSLEAIVPRIWPTALRTRASPPAAAKSAFRSRRKGRRRPKPRNSFAMGL